MAVAEKHIPASQSYFYSRHHSDEGPIRAKDNCQTNAGNDHQDQGASIMI